LPDPEIEVRALASDTPREPICGDGLTGSPDVWTWRGAAGQVHLQLRPKEADPEAYPTAALALLLEELTLEPVDARGEPVRVERFVVALAEVGTHWALPPPSWACDG